MVFDEFNQHQEGNDVILNINEIVELDGDDDKPLETDEGNDNEDEEEEEHEKKKDFEERSETVQVGKLPPKKNIRLAKINPLCVKNFFAIGREKVKKMNLEETRYNRNKRRGREANMSEEMYNSVSGPDNGIESEVTKNAFDRFGFNL